MTFPTQDHIAAAQDAADRVYAKTKFYCWPSVSLVQAKWESASGTKLSGKFNFFGIKANAAQKAAGKYTVCRTREVVNGKDVYINDAFADFDSLSDAYEAHAMLFVRVKVYAAGLKSKSARQFMIEIGPHYATDPTYATKLIADMDRGNYYQYDRRNLGGVSVPVKPSANSTAKAQGPVAGAIVVAGGGIAAAAHGGGSPALLAALIVAAVAAALGAFAWWRSHQAIADIPPLPPPPVPATAAAHLTVTPSPQK